MHRHCANVKRFCRAWQDFFTLAAPVATWLRRECSGWPNAGAGAAAFDAVARGTGAEVLFAGGTRSADKGGFAAGFGTVGAGFSGV